MNNPSDFPNAERSAVVALLREALGPEWKIAGRTGRGGEVEVRRTGGDPVRLHLRRWSGETSPGEASALWVIRAGRPSILRGLREHRQNFVALTGAARLVLPGLHLDRTDLKPAARFPALASRAQPFADRNSLIVRTLLAHPGRMWSVRELSQQAGVALGTASSVVRALVQARVLRSETAGRRSRIWLDDAEPLLERWFAAYSWERNERVAFHAPVGDPQRFVQRLPVLLAGERWALTLQAGASRVAPHAAWDRVHLYVDVKRGADLLALGHELGWEPAPDGRVVLMRPYYRSAVWEGVQILKDLPVVSIVQLVVDLWHYPLRGREQAEHLLNSVLLEHWHDRAGRPGADAPGDSR